MMGYNMLKNRLFIGIGILVVLSGCYKRSKNVPVNQENSPLPAFFDVRPSQRPVSYLYAPGFQTTEAAMGRFCPSYTAVTGEKLTWKSGGHVIGQPHSAVVFSEIDLRKPTYFTFNPITAFINSLRRDLAPLAGRVLQDSLNFTVEDNPNSKLSVVNYSFNFSKANLGQKADIRALEKTYKEHIKKYPEHEVILYGDSRGAATIFNFISLHKPEQVKAAVLEGIFDTIPHTVKHFLYTDKKPCEEQRLYNMVQFFVRSYRKDGHCPRTCADIISDDIPLLFVISLNDGLVAPQSAFYLYNCLRAKGHQKVHLLILKKSSHPMYMIGDPEDKKVYESTVHAFYKQYNLPYNSTLAELGRKSFQATLPTAEFLERTYGLPHCDLCTAKVCNTK